jgi:hypothetical protein
MYEICAEFEIFHFRENFLEKYLRFSRKFLQNSVFFIFANIFAKNLGDFSKFFCKNQHFLFLQKFLQKFVIKFCKNLPIFTFSRERKNAFSFQP